MDTMHVQRPNLDLSRRRRPSAVSVDSMTQNGIPSAPPPTPMAPLTARARSSSDAKSSILRLMRKLLAFVRARPSTSDSSLACSERRVYTPYPSDPELASPASPTSGFYMPPRLPSPPPSPTPAPLRRRISSLAQYPFSRAVVPARSLMDLDLNASVLALFQRETDPTDAVDELEVCVRAEREVFGDKDEHGAA